MAVREIPRGSWALCFLAYLSTVPTLLGILQNSGSEYVDEVVMRTIAELGLREYNFAQDGEEKSW